MHDDRGVSAVGERGVVSWGVQRYVPWSVGGFAVRDRAQKGLETGIFRSARELQAWSPSALWPDYGRVLGTF